MGVRERDESRGPKTSDRISWVRDSAVTLTGRLWKGRALGRDQEFLSCCGAHIFHFRDLLEEGPRPACAPKEEGAWLTETPDSGVSVLVCGSGFWSSRWPGRATSGANRLPRGSR